MDPNTIPAIPAPAGMVSNFANPSSFAWVTILTMVVYIVIVTPFVAARVYTRALVQKSLWWDDASQVIALVGLYALAGIAIALNKYGSGTDAWNVTMAQYLKFNMLFGDFAIVARVSIFFTKLSILQMYMRYFCPARSNRNWIYYATHAVIVFNLLYSIALILVVLLECAGQHPKPGQSCINDNGLLVSASVINTLTDLMVLVIPVAAVSQMQMARKTKLGVLAVFAVATLAIITSVARLAYQITQEDSKNSTIENAIVVILAVAEQAIGQVAGCMPILPALYRHLRHKSKSGSYTYDSSLYDSNSRRTKPSYPLRGGGDLTELDDVDLRQSNRSSRDDEEWQSKTAATNQDRLYIPLTKAPVTTPALPGQYGGRRARGTNKDLEKASRHEPPDLVRSAGT